LAVALVAGPARSQEAPGPPPPLPPAPRIHPDASPLATSGLGADLGVGFAFLTPPTMALGTPDGGAMKQFAGTPLTHVGAMDMVDLSIGVLFRTASPLVIQLVGFEFGIPVKTGYPGSIALETKPAPLSWIKGGPTFYDGLDIGGLGVELTAGTFRFGLDAMPGFRFVRTTGTITQGVLTVDAEASEYTFSLRAEVKACAGGKAAFSGCLYGAPHVFEFGKWMNGAVFGLRVETN
jgi:hypothetical protein